MYIHQATFDDLLHDIFELLLQGGRDVKASRGANREITGVLLELDDPRARLSRTETKGTIFSCLGELLWYLSGSDSLSFIQYYLRRYDENSEDRKTIYGAYGPRLFRMHGRFNQIENVIGLLKEKPTSRRAVIQIFDAEDIAVTKRVEIPCTCSLQFLLRDGRLDLLASMRSNDVFFGLPHDVFAFTMFQEIVARSLGVEVGHYKHFVGSLHLYETQVDNARAYLNEGIQATQGVGLPPMPDCDPEPAIATLLRAEATIRNGEDFNLDDVDLDAYWCDLIKLLKIFQYSKRRDTAKIDQTKATMAFPIYATYINDRQLRHL